MTDTKKAAEADNQHQEYLDKTLFDDIETQSAQKKQLSIQVNKSPTSLSSIKPAISP